MDPDVRIFGLALNCRRQYLRINLVKKGHNDKKQMYLSPIRSYIDWIASLLTLVLAWLRGSSTSNTRAINLRNVSVRYAQARLEACPLRLSR